MRLKCVPFNSTWPSAVGQSGALLLDIHAIYRRPHVIAPKDRASYFATDAAGFPIWDLTGGLPVRDHAKWTARGFQYVTLETRDDLRRVSQPSLAEQGAQPLEDATSYEQHPVTRDPWHASAYLADLREEREQETEQLRQLIRSAGPAVAEQVMRNKYPTFSLPEAFVDEVLRASVADTGEGEEPQTSPTTRPRGRPRKVVAEVPA